MRLYRHHKSKFYKYLATVQHSETLEELVLYETRYDSPGGRVWVRPKEMFHGVVETETGLRTRFAPVPLELRHSEGVTESDLERLKPLALQIFQDWRDESVLGTLQSHSRFYLVEALVDGDLVGFKLGYQTHPKEFYSWLGGIRPDMRGLGVAADLMTAQHEWCKSQGYQRIHTKTRNKFRDMLILNIRFGFQVVGTERSGDGDLAILLEKTLN